MTDEPVRGDRLGGDLAGGDQASGDLASDRLGGDLARRDTAIGDPVGSHPAGAEPIEPDPFQQLYVGENSGQVAHTVHGGMHQYVHVETRRAVNQHGLVPDYVREVADVYVEPPFQRLNGGGVRFTDLAADLAGRGAVVLVGAPGSGRHTSAVALLARSGLARLDEIHPEPGTVFALADLRARPDTGFLLDVTGTTVQAGFGRAVLDKAAELHRAGSCLVVVADESDVEDTGELTARPGRPPAGEVLVRRLERELGTVAARRWADEPAVADALTGLPAADAVRFAELVGGLGIGADPGLDADVVLRAFRRWDRELQAWFTDTPELARRAFLIAAAVLEGRSGTDVLWAADVLLAAATGGVERISVLAGAGVREFADHASVDLGPEDGPQRVAFVRPAYGRSIVEHVLSDRTARFGTEFWRWCGELPMLLPDPDGTLTQVGRLGLSYAIEHRRPAIVAALAQKWSSRRDLRRSTVEILTLAALSDEIGGAVRRTLYTWVTTSSSVPLLLTVADVCGGPLAEVFLDQALTRLRHLARHADGQVRRAVLAAGLRIWWEQPAARPRLLDELHRWLAGPDEARRGTAHAVVAGLLTPSPGGRVPAMDSGRQVVIDGVVTAVAATVDDRHGRDLFRPALPALFAAADAHADLSDQVVGLFVRSVEVPPVRSMRVAAIRAVIPSGPTADALVSRLRTVDPLRRALTAGPVQNGASQ